MPRAGQIKAAVMPRLPDRIAIGVLTGTFPPELVDRVVTRTGRGEQRQRLLPARVVVYYTLAMCLFARVGYEEVMQLLIEGLSRARRWQVPHKSSNPGPSDQEVTGSRKAPGRLADRLLTSGQLLRAGLPRTARVACRTSHHGSTARRRSVHRPRRRHGRRHWHLLILPAGSIDRDYRAERQDQHHDGGQDQLDDGDDAGRPGLLQPRQAPAG
jgi:transposase IS4-like protein